VTCTISDGVPAGFLEGVGKAQFLPDACPPGHSNGVAFWQGALLRCPKGAEESERTQYAQEAQGCHVPVQHPHSPQRSREPGVADSKPTWEPGAQLALGLTGQLAERSPAHRCPTPIKLPLETCACRALRLPALPQIPRDTSAAPHAGWACILAPDWSPNPPFPESGCRAEHCVSERRRHGAWPLCEFPLKIVSRIPRPISKHSRPALIGDCRGCGPCHRRWCEQAGSEWLRAIRRQLPRLQRLQLWRPPARRHAHPPQLLPGTWKR
jgi:hypothetical protein